jgi:Asp-tRNA(Asn)/Glu-tRNA(Gln) amidotransferase A subunit family amidase
MFPWKLSAREALTQIRAGKLSSVELIESCLERCGEREPVTRAFTRLADRARWEADATGASDRPLAGLPVAVKDVIDTSDLVTEYGSPIWTDYRPVADAAVVSLARSAGAVVFGKTVTTAFATMTPGATTNPHNLAHTPGGSSSGSAAAVAYGAVPLALGTQTAGSLIRPAAFCGVVAYKPTFGTIHRAGMKVMSESLDTIGVFAREVADCALFVSATCGMDLGDPARKLDRAPRLGVTLGPAGELATPAMRQRLDEVIAAAARAGAEIVEVVLPQEADEAFRRHADVMYGESLQALAWERREHGDRLADALRLKLDSAEKAGPEAVRLARMAFVAARAAMSRLFDEMDAILTPSAPGEAPLGLAFTGDPSFNQLWTALHGPCVGIPAGTGPLGLPLGVQVVGPVDSDRDTLAIAAWLAAAIS